MTLSPRTVSTLIASHIAATSEFTERPRPYRARRRRAGWIRLALVLAAVACITVARF